MARNSAPKPTNLTLEEIDQLRVTLKPVFGIAPRTYVPVLWALLLLLVAFYLFAFPGFVKYGSIVTFRTNPPGASVYIDGIRIGATPVSASVRAGTREIEYRLPFTPIVRESVSIPGRRLFSRFVPRKVTLSAAIEGYHSAEGHLDAVRDFSGWALAGDPSSQFQIPWVASGEALRIRSARRPEDELAWTEDFLQHVGNTAQLADVARATFLVSQKSSLIDPVAVAEMIQKIVQLDNNSGAIPQLAAAYLPPGEAVAALRESDWYEVNEQRRGTALLTTALALDEGPQGPVESANRTYGGVQFAYIPASTYIEGYPMRDANVFGRSRETFAVLIQSQEVSQSLFSRFLDERPEWRAENRPELIARGLVDDEYLGEWSDDDAEPVRFISVYAAEAFAEWFTGTYLSSTGLQARLPRLTEWEYAAFLDQNSQPTVIVNRSGPVPAAAGVPGSQRLYHMAGNVWEWTSTWHADNRGYFPEDTPVSGEMRVVAGGSYANTQTDYTRHGAQPPVWCTPYTGFRLALYRSGESR